MGVVDVADGALSYTLPVGSSTPGSSVVVAPDARAARAHQAALVAASLALMSAGLAVSGTPGLALLAAACAPAALIPFARTGVSRFDPFELGLVIALLYFLLFPLRAVVVLTDAGSAVNPRVTAIPAPTLRVLFVVVALGLLAGGVGYNASVGAALGRRLRIPKITGVERPRAVFAWAVFAIGLTADALVTAANRFPGRTSFAPLGGERISGLISAASVGVAVGLFLLTRNALESGRTSARIQLVVATIAVVAVGVVGTYKEVAIDGLLVPLLAWHFGHPQGVKVRWIVLAAAIVLIVVFPVVEVARQAERRLGTTNPATIAAALPAQVSHYSLVHAGRRRDVHPSTLPREVLIMESRRFYGLDSVALAVAYTPRTIPFQLGRKTLVELAAGPIPRVLWPGKPEIGLGSWFDEHYWQSGNADIPIVPQSVTHLGELWIDFGLFGVVVGMALLGAFYRFVWEALRPRSSPTGALVYAVVFLTVVVVDRDIPLVYVTLMQRLAALAVLLFILHWLDKRRRPA